MNSEWLKKNIEKKIPYFSLLTLVAVSLLNVSFPNNKNGKIIFSNKDLEGLYPLEKLVGKKLLELGIVPQYERVNILLDEGADVGTGRPAEKKKKTKDLTVPDFHFQINGVDCFIEVGRQYNGNKRDQGLVAEKALKFPEVKDVLYVQLLGREEIEKMINEVFTQEELLEFLINHPKVIYFDQQNVVS